MLEALASDSSTFEDVKDMSGASERAFRLIKKKIKKRQSFLRLNRKCLFLYSFMQVFAGICGKRYGRKRAINGGIRVKEVPAGGG
jgi:hypothetical protein